MAPSTVDQFIAHRVLPRFHPIVAVLRALMKKHAPSATEIMTYGILGWRGTRILAVLSPTKKDLTFAFSRGAELVDRHHLLRGVGSVSRHVKLADLDDVDPVALRDYIAQAVKLDGKPRAKRPAAKRPAAKRPAAKRPAAKRPAAKRPVTARRRAR